MTKTFKHINDCWNAIEDCETIEEVRQVLGDLPRKFGEWWIDTVSEDGIPCYEVTNQYWDDQYEEFCTDTRTLEVPVDEEDL